MGIMANSEDPDEMLHKAAFHQGLHCLLRLSNLLGQKYIFFYRLTSNPLIYKMDNSILIVSISMG